MGLGKDVLGVVGKVAPSIASALGGPLAGTAAKYLADKFLNNPNATEAQIETAILQSTPSDLARLKEIDNTFVLEMRKLGITEFGLVVEDRKSARDLFRVNIWPQIVLSAIFTVGYFLVLKAILEGSANISQDMQPVANVVIGVLTAAMTTILAFWFGSSFGSKEKSAGLLMAPPPK